MATERDFVIEAIQGNLMEVRLGERCSKQLFYQIRQRV